VQTFPSLMGTAEKARFTAQNPLPAEQKYPRTAAQTRPATPKVWRMPHIWACMQKRSACLTA
jgi:hypothetical protein